MNIQSPSDKCKIRGFTLIEILFVAVCIGILAAVAYPAYTDFIKNQKVKDTKVAMLGVMQNLDKFFGTNKRYTTDLLGDLNYSSESILAGGTEGNEQYEISILDCSNPVGSGNCSKVMATPEDSTSYPLIMLWTNNRIFECSGSGADRR